MTDADRLARLRHDLANPLSAILIETQLILLRSEELPPDIAAALKDVETAAVRMRTILQEFSAG
ncbi:MAG: hypothetical protein HOP28_16325 [Gemmatimonadales bacterium]|nr:hypothetical protein [Gemmatimonadales bacterium]